jgi:hypothetical protein
MVILSEQKDGWLWLIQLQTRQGGTRPWLGGNIVVVFVVAHDNFTFVVCPLL